MIAASLVAIEKGAYFFATMPPEVEILLHALCGFVGAIAFVGYVTSRMHSVLSAAMRNSSAVLYCDHATDVHFIAFTTLTCIATNCRSTLLHWLRSTGFSSSAPTS